MFRSSCALLLSLAPLARAGDPVTFGLLAAPRGERTAPDAAFVEGARFAVERWNAQNPDVPLALSVESCSDDASLAAAITRLDAAGVLALVAPLDPALAESARRIVRGTLPCAGFATPAANLAAALDELGDVHWRTTRIGFAHDGHKDGRELAKLLAKGLPRSGAALVFECDLAPQPKPFAKELDATRPEILVVDGEPAAAAKFLRESASVSKLPVVLTPRACGAAVYTSGVDVFALLGRSPETVRGAESFRADWAKSHAELPSGVAEGFESVSFLARALGAKRDRASVLAALASVKFDGPRGPLVWDPKFAALVAPLGVWRIRGERVAPWAPAAFALRAGDEKTAVAATPDATLGVAFGTWRTRQFQLAEDTQWVVCSWADESPNATIDEDLAELGLSTKGESPLVDHLVKDELLARVIAITNTKFLRNEDGSAIPGKSFKISFSARAPKKSAKFWPARYGGDHTDAGGEAFGDHCNVYSTFIRRTIFQPHALKPPVAADDLAFLDGTYRYGTDAALDHRSELIRALVNGYAGSMALTTAHEVGHLCTLDHVEDDPVDIMNVAEGAGIGYEVAHFGATSYPRLVKRLGLAGAKK